MKIFDLIKFDSRNKIYALINEQSKHMQICLKTCSDTYILFNDLIEHFFNVYMVYLTHYDKMLLNGSLKLSDMGLLLNLYYYNIANDIYLDQKQFIQDENQNWIGCKYYCFENDNIATWVCIDENKFNFVCTPLYDGLFNESEQEFGDFMKNYKDLFRTSMKEDRYIEFLNNIQFLIREEGR